MRHFNYRLEADLKKARPVVKFRVFNVEFDPSREAGDT